MALYLITILILGHWIYSFYQFNLIKQKLKHMSKETDAIKASLAEANDSLANIAQDIITLNDAIQSATTSEEIAEIQNLSASLADKAKSIAEETPDSPPTV